MVRLVALKDDFHFKILEDRDMYQDEMCITGGGAVGGVDNVGRIQELCNNHEAWLHVEGHALAALTLPNAPNLVQYL